MYCTDMLYVHTYIHVSMCVYLAVSQFAFLFMAREIMKLLFFNRQ